MPTVSVLMPAFNHARYVGAAIDSVLGQSLGDLELIVIDDASADQTPQVIAEHTGDRRLRFSVHDANRGATETLNEALRLATGDYVSILNSDDVYADDRLAQLVHLARASSADLVMSDIALIDSAGDIIDDPAHWWVSWFNGLKEQLRRTGSPLKAFLTGNLAITSSNFFLSRRAVDALGGFSAYRYVHDYDYVLRFLEHFGGERFTFAAGARWLYYRLHHTNTIRTDPVGANRETLELLLRSMQTFARNLDDDTLVILSNHATRLLGYLADAHEQLRAAALAQQGSRYEQDLARERQASEISELRSRQLEARMITQEARIAELDHALHEVWGSSSFRLGHALLSPLRWVGGRLAP
ncbi:MAG: glycosyltransferase family 2 protein [Candidatus Schekmanbacteria bacterium]|nr:glycosyltransferase family 2 protein [Candidatus Schekmanbacteria bacterium]